MADPGDLFAACQELLDAAAEALDTVPDLLGTAFDGAPDRQFISPGPPVADCCEMLTVWAAQLTEGNRAPPLKSAGFRITLPQFNILILRCVPAGAVRNGKYFPPVPEDLTASAEQIDADAWAIWNHLFNMQSADPPLLFNWCDDVLWGPAQSQTPAGGCGGWQFTLIPQLDGYPEDLST